MNTQLKLNTGLKKVKTDFKFVGFDLLLCLTLTKCESPSHIDLSLCKFSGIHNVHNELEIHRDVRSTRENSHCGMEQASSFFHASV